MDKQRRRPLTFVGDLPEQCAALNRTNINVQLLTIEAAKTLKKDYIYQAATAGSAHRSASCPSTTSFPCATT